MLDEKIASSKFQELDKFNLYPLVPIQKEVFNLKKARYYKVCFIWLLKEPQYNCVEDSLFFISSKIYINEQLNNPMNNLIC